MGFFKSLFGGGRRSLDDLDEYQVASHIASVLDGSIRIGGYQLIAMPEVCLVWGWAGQKGFALCGKAPTDGESFVSLRDLPGRALLLDLAETSQQLPEEIRQDLYDSLGQRAVDQLALEAWRAYKAAWASA